MDAYSFNGYNVPLIPAGLRHEETIIQTANALEYLNNTINDIFDKINNRVNRNNNKIQEIQNRIEKVNEKITSLVGTKKAICIFSPAKFPALHVLKDIPATFNEESYKNINFKLNADYEIESDLEPLTQTSLQDKLEFFYVRETPELSNISKILNTSNSLGPIPSTLKSVNSLLLYNTDQNVYLGERERGIFKGQTEVRVNEDKNELIKKIEAAPISITTRQLGAEKKLHQKLFYTPKLNDAPDINLPLDLPDLPGIADNIHFEVNKKEKIAPSLLVENDYTDHNVQEKKQKSPEIIQTQDEAVKIENVNISKTIPEQPIEVLNIATNSKPIASENYVNVLPPIPPPPPPPMPEKSEIEKTVVKSKPKTTPPKVPDASNARSNLMEDIRKAGGIRGGKLRAAADVISDTSANNSSKQSPNNLMDDLHKKLLMRRKGISGSKDNDKNSNVFDKISSLIPPPPKPSQGMYSSTSDNDNDNDDWDSN